MVKLLLVITQAPLLSGTLRDCAQIENLSNPEEVPLDDSTCSTGGLAAVDALHRMYNTNPDNIEQSGSTTVTPSLVLPMADFKSPLTIMSRFGFGVNVMIFGELGFRTWTLPAYTLWPGRIEEHAVYHLHDPDLPALLSNVVTSPTEVAHSYIQSIHFDEKTKLAIMYFTKEYLENTHSQVLSAQRLLQYIYKRNQAYGCDLTNQPTGYTVPRSGYSAFQSQSFSAWFSAVPDPNRNMSFPIPSNSTENCFLSVIIFDDEDKIQYDSFMESLLQPNQPDIGDAVLTLRPHLLVDIYGHGLISDETDILIEPMNVTDGSDNPTTWVVSYVSTTTDYHQIELTISQDSRSVESVQVTHDDLTDLPPQVSASIEYIADLEKLRQYAREALLSSLANEPGVSTESMPAMTSTVDGYRSCYTGECEMGNLVTDAIRWADQVDVALLPSFILDGPGWAAGEIRILELLENIPYTAPRCNATLTGNSLLRILQHSISLSSFGPYDDVQTGGRLLQVSGLRLVYNAELDSSSGNIISLEVWDRDQGIFQPLNRTKLYTVASGNHLCFTFQDYPEYLGSFLVEKGEIPALADPDSEIKTDVKKYLMEEFYSKGETYRPRLEGRMRPDLSSNIALAVEEEYNCVDGESFWDSAVLLCAPCPTYARVHLSEDSAQLFGQAYSKGPLRHQVTITNREEFVIQVSAETMALPENIQVISIPPKLSPTTIVLPQSNSTNGNVSSTSNTTGSFVDNEEVFTLGPNQTILFQVNFDSSQRNPGTDTSSLVFSIQELHQSGNCTKEFKIKHEIVARLDMSTDMNTLKGAAYFGYAAAAVVISTAIFFAAWVYYRRQTRLVSSMQPLFLVTLCFGVALMGSSLIALSIDDGVASQAGCDIACMSRPWLLSLGCTISVTALYSKLRRINKLFHCQQFRRVKVREKDVVFPTVMIILLNLVLLIIWTVKDPIRWDRTEVEEQPWNTYGKCLVGDGIVATAMLFSIIVLCGVTFSMTVWQAFRARNISSAFSESKYLGIAVFSWVQLLMVGIPASFLVDDDNVVARYFLVVGLLIAVCLSMLLVIFVPMLMQTRSRENGGSRMVSFNDVGRNGTTNPNDNVPTCESSAHLVAMRNIGHQDGVDGPPSSDMNAPRDCPRELSTSQPIASSLQTFDIICRELPRISSKTSLESSVKGNQDCNFSNMVVQDNDTTLDSEPSGMPHGSLDSLPAEEDVDAVIYSC